MTKRLEMHNMHKSTIFMSVFVTHGYYELKVTY